LMPLDETTAPLLVGREFDVARAAALLDDGSARLVLVHGAPGVGKSSLLRAGVVPFLEERCLGYRVLRSRAGAEEGAEPPASEFDYPVLPIRSTSDLGGQLALGLAEFCDRPLSYTTPTGRTVTVDLPGLLAAAVHGQSAKGSEPPSVEDIRVAL